jgi:type IX secretion system substrate protein
MKKLLIILLIIVGNAKPSPAQINIYHPFPEDTATWVTDMVYSACMGYCGTNFYEMKGDTLINSESYNKIYVRYGRFYNISAGIVGTDSFAVCSYIGAIRQDSINKKVFFIDPTMTTDTLLYDFDLTVGDTIQSWFNKWSMPFPLIVSGIDSISINGNYHKMFNFQGYGNGIITSLIEGVGWSGELFGIHLSGGGLWTFLACFEGNVIVQETFINECSASLDCSIFADINEQNGKKDFSFFPNPFSIQTVLQTDNFLSNATIEFYNLYGQQVKQLKNIYAQTITIKRDNLPGGFYFIQLIENNKIIAKNKLLITD